MDVCTTRVCYACSFIIAFTLHARSNVIELSHSTTIRTIARVHDRCIGVLLRLWLYPFDYETIADSCFALNGYRYTERDRSFRDIEMVCEQNLSCSCSIVYERVT